MIKQTKIKKEEETPKKNHIKIKTEKGEKDKDKPK